MFVELHNNLDFYVGKDNVFFWFDAWGRRKVTAEFSFLLDSVNFEFFYDLFFFSKILFQINKYERVFDLYLLLSNLVKIYLEHKLEFDIVVFFFKLLDVIKTGESFESFCQKDLLILRKLMILYHKEQIDYGKDLNIMRVFFCDYIQAKRQCELGSFSVKYSYIAYVYEEFYLFDYLVELFSLYKMKASVFCKKSQYRSFYIRKRILVKDLREVFLGDVVGLFICLFLVGQINEISKFYRDEVCNRGGGYRNIWFVMGYIFSSLCLYFFKQLEFYYPLKAWYILKDLWVDCSLNNSFDIVGEGKFRSWPKGLLEWLVFFLVYNSKVDKLFNEYRWFGCFLKHIGYRCRFIYIILVRLDLLRDKGIKFKNKGRVKFQVYKGLYKNFLEIKKFRLVNNYSYGFKLYEEKIWYLVREFVFIIWNLYFMFKYLGLKFGVVKKVNFLSCFVNKYFYVIRCRKMFRFRVIKSWKSINNYLQVSIIRFLQKIYFKPWLWYVLKVDYSELELVLYLSTEKMGSSFVFVISILEIICIWQILMKKHRFNYKDWEENYFLVSKELNYKKSVFLFFKFSGFQFLEKLLLDTILVTEKELFLQRQKLEQLSINEMEGVMQFIKRVYVSPWFNLIKVDVEVLGINVEFINSIFNGNYSFIVLWEDFDKYVNFVKMYKQELVGYNKGFRYSLTYQNKLFYNVELCRAFQYCLNFSNDKIFDNLDLIEIDCMLCWLTRIYLKVGTKIKHIMVDKFYQGIKVLVDIDNKEICDLDYREDVGMYYFLWSELIEIKGYVSVNMYYDEWGWLL